MTPHTVAAVSGAERFAIRLVTGVATLAVFERLRRLLPELVMAGGAIAGFTLDMFGMEERHHALPGGKCDLFRRLLILGRSRRQPNNRRGCEESNDVPHACEYNTYSYTFIRN